MLLPQGLSMPQEAFSKLLTLQLASGSWERPGSTRDHCASSAVWISPGMRVGHVDGVSARRSVGLGCECFGKGLVA